MRQGRGIMMMRWRTYSQEFSAIPVPFPPLNEQNAIVEFLNRKIQEIDGLIENIRKQIEKLKIYKQRLISDAVTGKIDVRNTDLSAGSDEIEEYFHCQQTQNNIRGGK